MVRDRCAERDVGARNRDARAGHSCYAGRSGRPGQPGRERVGALERKSGAVRRAHTPRLRTLPRSRQSGEAQARVTDAGRLLARIFPVALSVGSGSWARLFYHPGAAADHAIAQAHLVSAVHKRTEAILSLAFARAPLIRAWIVLVQHRRFRVGWVGRVLLKTANEIERGTQRFVVLRIRRDVRLRAGLLVPLGL